MNGDKGRLSVKTSSSCVDKGALVVGQGRIAFAGEGKALQLSPHT
jgi:hypothetical protein